CSAVNATFSFNSTGNGGQITSTPDGAQNIPPSVVPLWFDVISRSYKTTYREITFEHSCGLM
ncbi:MAG: hypothetical protein WC951_07065, partial [Bacteroidales bacterium]